MQIIRLINPGKVDKVMAFDSLPLDLVRGLTIKEADGFPRHWKNHLKEVDSSAEVTREEGGKKIKETKYGFFLMEYKTVNKDKERWQEIVSYVRRKCDPSIRLLDNFEDMAKPLAADAVRELTLEPEDVPIISLVTVSTTVNADKEVKVETNSEGAVEVKIPRRRGRPAKEATVNA